MYKEITTIPAVLKAMGIAPDFVPDVSMWPESMRAHKITEFNLQMMVLAINGPDWVPNWSDTAQYKFFPWWRIVRSENGVSGRGLALYGVDYDGTMTAVGPRLVFENREKTNHAAKYFLPLYEAYYLGGQQ